MNVTMGHRTLAIRQSAVTTLVGVLTMLALYLTERTTPSLDGQSLNVWALATVINVVARLAMYRWLFSLQKPVDVARSTATRVVPLAIAVLATFQWIWSIELFGSHQSVAPLFILFAGLFGTSVAVAGMWPTAPIATITYLVATWGILFRHLFNADSFSAPMMVASVLGVSIVLWACSYLQIQRVQTILDRSDEVDLLVANLHRTNEELKSTNSTLDSMRSAAASELNSRSMFFSSASHDFRQRLHAMNLLSNAALSAAGGDKTESPSLKRLVDSVEDVERYVTDVLDFARFDGHAIHADRKRVELQPLFQRLELNFEDIASEQGVTLLFRSTEIVLFSDPSMLLRILENLVSNAIKFTSGRVIVAARRRADAVAVQVWDQGTGIAADDQQAIFTPFYRSTTAEMNQRGVGLGLAVVKRFADCLGYKILVRSHLGRGSVMTLLVPLIDVVGLDESLDP
jgi:signal transduction histidine kinase